ncbi:MAG: type 1 glutamine amidotransferase domain-containing protein [Chitinophagaceae bacterium]
MKSLNSLLITTSNKLDSDAYETGVWLESLAASYFILKDGGEFITIASPQGGQVPHDSKSLSATEHTEYTIRFQQDSQAMYHLSHSLPLNEVKAGDFDLVLLAGGYGAMWDFADNEQLKQILEDFNLQNKPIGLVGHAVVALGSLKMNTGEPFVKNRKITAFSNSEEELAGWREHSSFALESKLIALGALYSKGAVTSSYVVVDNNIITGQNPASSVETAKQVLAFAHRKQTIEIANSNKSI